MCLGEKCGAVTAMIMVAGLAYGSFDGSDAKKKNELKDIVKKLNGCFEAEFGSSQCRTLLGNIGQGKYDLSRTKEQGKRPCAIFMEKACDILEQDAGALKRVEKIYHLLLNFVSLTLAKAWHFR